MAKPTFTAGTKLAALKLTQIADFLYGTDGWTNLTLVNSWVSYGFPYSTAGYRVSADVVHLRGMVKVGNVGRGYVHAPLRVRVLLRRDYCPLCLTASCRRWTLRPTVK